MPRHSPNATAFSKQRPATSESKRTALVVMSMLWTKLTSSTISSRKLSATCISAESVVALVELIVDLVDLFDVVDVEHTKGFPPC